MAGNDFVQVQLTERGEQVAGGAPLRLSNGRRTFLFEPGKTLRVERSYEWLAVLSQHATHDGEALFELVPAPAFSTDQGCTAAVEETT